MKTKIAIRNTHTIATSSISLRDKLWQATRSCTGCIGLNGLEPLYYML